MLGAAKKRSAGAVQQRRRGLIVRTYNRGGQSPGRGHEHDGRTLDRGTDPLSLLFCWVLLHDQVGQPGTMPCGGAAISTAV